MTTNLFMHSEACISSFGEYRYWLRRTWDAALPPLCWVMLNPSTADDRLDDPTIRRCLSFAQAWGYGSIRVVNLYALRATNPLHLWKTADPVGPDNDQHIIDQCAGQHVIAAWGVNARLQRVEAVAKILQPVALSVECLGLTKDRCPRHPLFVRGDKSLSPFSWR